ncbi:TRAP transporter small permease subunit [Amorphus orientalis]|uniref:TRAP transporter small permease protein n=1 Tax=Amorphus orientalis TaxID=649198 RepID=A0AAE3VR14_9HYPH|nr:TRAP transporter small permease subunit [Amorphus orientalis]MDQ0316583.1 TRAP-type mannitol/chloroaromatic compound transport system permease small subunit [Amorphus orientalis]
MRAIAQAIDAINLWSGKVLAWLALAIVVVQFVVVVMRYVFGLGSIQMQELIIYMHGFLFMLAAAYTLRVDGHVRIDVFYREATPRRKAWINLLGCLFFLLPVCALIFWISWPYVANSWAIMEGSRESSGIQGVFLLKTAILAFAVQMGLQGVSMMLHSVLAIMGDESELDALRIPSHTP